MARKYLVQTFGCQMNEHDSERIAADFDGQGLERTNDVDAADIVVLNTCCIRENADNKFYGHLGHLKSIHDARPEMQIAVGGCLAQKDREAIVKRAPFVDAVFGTHNIGRAKTLLDQARELKRPVVEVLERSDGDDVMPSALHIRPEIAYAAWVTIQAGCDNSCAFCIVPTVRGKELSRPFGELVAEIEKLAANGTTEVTLLGQNVNSYGRDLTLRLRKACAEDEPAIAGGRWSSDPSRRARPLFPDLLRAVGSIEGIERVRFTSPHPKDLSDETIDAMATTPAICEQLHLPVQSGSDSVLSRMRRGYTAERYLERLARARASIDDLAISTDIIVGFPGETEAEFEDTLALVAEVAFDSAYTFIFSPRQGTRAAALVDQFVADDVIQDRFGRLKDVVDRASLRANESRIGRVEDVVVEGVSKRSAGVLNARTRQGKLVHFTGSLDAMAPGTHRFVRIERAGAHHLSGVLTSASSGAPAEGQSRERIAVRSD